MTNKIRVRAEGWGKGRAIPPPSNSILEIEKIQIFFKKIKKLIIYSDSQYVINTITKWYKGWKARGWKKSDGKKPLNLDLL